MRRVVSTLLLLAACDGSPSDTGAGAGGQGGTSTTGGAGGETTTSPCVCQPLPACAVPDDYAIWCSFKEYGDYPAVFCKDCGGDYPVCTEQASTYNECLGGNLWCCRKDFNPEPTPQDWHCIGSVACEENLEACEYDEVVSALSAEDAAIALLNECRAEHPEMSCGLWTLTCEPAP